MATIRTAIQVTDGMTGPFKSMNNVMNIVLNSFEALQSASSNAIDTGSIQAARAELARAEIAFNDVEREIREADAAQQQLNEEIRNGQHAASGLAGKIKTVVGAFVGIAAVKKSIGAIGSWLNLADVQIASENQLATVMKNMGATRDEFESIRKAASNVQLNTTFGDEALLGGAAELATYLKSGDAIEAMMGTLANYAAGMGGMDVDKAGMVEYATQLGKALDGQFDGLRKKGFEVTDAQKAIIEKGTEMERVAVITEIISQSWDGLAESMTNTPQGQLIQMKNTFGDIKETIGKHLYPAVMKFFGTLNANMPFAESMMMGFANAAIVVMNILGGILDTASSVYEFFSNNWGWISPIIWGIVAALIAYNAVLGIHKAITIASAIATGIKALATNALAIATGTATAAQWSLNAALLASPITWIILLIIALIAVFYAVVAAVNHFAGTSVSATGIIFGAFAVLGAFLWNLFLGLLDLVFGVINAMVNPFIRIANFIGNVFTSPISSIIYLFQSMADGVLAILQKVAKAMDFVFGSKMADTVAGWRSGLKEMADAAVAEYAPNENYQNVMDELNLSVDSIGLKRWEYGDAWNTGYKAGENLESKFDLSNILAGASGDLNAFEFGNQLDGIYRGVDDTAYNTASMKDSMEASEEELKYLREIAEQEVINRFTTAEIKVEMNNNNTITSNMDLDGVVTYLEEKVYESMVVAAEGVHS